MNRVARKLHLQRVSASFITSAFMAAEFHRAHVTAARDMTSKLHNDVTTGLRRRLRI